MAMDEIDFKGIVYVSSKRAAKMAGYTNDYVGQLCREGRIKCRRIGRDWYIKEESILEHKSKKSKSKVIQKKSTKSQTLENSGSLYYKKDYGNNTPIINKKKDEKNDKKDFSSSVSAKNNQLQRRDSGVKVKISKNKDIGGSHRATVPRRHSATGKDNSTGQFSVIKPLLLFLFILFLLLAIIVLGGGLLSSRIDYDSGAVEEKVTI